MANLERRSVAASLRSLGDKMEIGGMAVAYDTLSQDLGGFRERIRPGAFSRSLRSGQDVRALFNHDQNQVLGRTGNGTLSLQDGADGLRFVVKLNPESQSHRDLHASIKRGDVSECSFAFALDGQSGTADTFDDVEENIENRKVKVHRRSVHSAHLFDVSPVTFPAYKGSTHVSARSAANYTASLHSPAPFIPNWSELRKKANRQATEIFMAAPGCRMVGKEWRAVPMTADECLDPSSWGTDEIFIFDVDIRARLRGAVLGAKIREDFERESDRQLIADIERQYGI